jgi:NADH-quinone oxidoreductase subunit N
MGYFLSAFIGGGRFGIIAATYYLTAYVVTLIVAFGVLSMLSRRASAETIADIRALSARSPWLAGAFTVACASFAGLPLAAGFFGKFYALASMAHTGAWVLAITLVATSGIGIYYYLKIISAMFEKPVAGEVPETPAMTQSGDKIPRSFLSAAVLSVAVITVLILGIVPAPLTGLIAHIVGK